MRPQSASGGLSSTDPIGATGREATLPLHYCDQQTPGLSTSRVKLDSPKLNGDSVKKAGRYTESSYIRSRNQKL